MSTNHHTPYVDGTTLFRATDMNVPLGELDAEITSIAATLSAQASTLATLQSDVTDLQGDVADVIKRSVCIVPVESDTDTAIADGTVAFTVPASMTAHDLTAALASVHTKGVTGTLDVQIRRRRAGTDADMLSTLITIGDEWYAADGVINTSNDDIQTGDQIFIDVDAIHTGTAAKGLSVTMTFEPQ
jgi:hypothetical protein